MRRYPPVWLGAVLLCLALLWRMVGAPVNVEQLQALQTPFWQARILLPSRSERILRLWFPQANDIRPQTMTEEKERETESVPAEDSTSLMVYMAQEERLARMTMAGYVCGVVAAEMPAAYHIEALKAQCVAARTRAMEQIMNGGCSLHPEADICTDSTHCQGYASLDKCRDMWGNSYEAYRDRILSAEAETRNDWLSYEGKPITILYHAISGGKTEEAATVFARAVPYLVSVDSRGEENAPGFRQDITFSFEEIAKRLNQNEAKSRFDAEQIRRNLDIVGYTESGRVDMLRIGNEEVRATDLRKALGLRSTLFSLSMDEHNVTFHQVGYGHGVGMSQAGANAMAANGSDYVQILMHYYPGVELKTE